MDLYSQLNEHTQSTLKVQNFSSIQTSPCESDHIERERLSVQAAFHAAVSSPFSSTKAKVLIVDDQEVVRKGISSMLHEHNDFEIVGQTACGHTAVMLTMQYQPDLVLMDIFLGALDGLDIAQQLMRACPATRIIIFTANKEDEPLFRALRIGVYAYLQKSMALHAVVEALRAVCKGERVLGDAHAVTEVLDEFSQLTKERDRTRTGLSELDIELVKLAASGCSNKEIAARQYWSEVTVKRKMQDIYRKLQVTDRAQAVAASMRMGLI